MFLQNSASLALTGLLLIAAQGCASDEADTSGSDDRSDVLESLWDCTVVCERDTLAYEARYQACALTDHDAAFEDGLVACSAEVLDGTCTRVEDVNNECTGRQGTPLPSEAPFYAEIEAAREKVAVTAGVDVSNLRLAALDFFGEESEAKQLVFYDATDYGSTKADEHCLWVYSLVFGDVQLGPSYEFFGTKKWGALCEGTAGLEEKIPTCSLDVIRPKIDAMGGDGEDWLSFEGGSWRGINEGDNYFHVLDDC